MRIIAVSVLIVLLIEGSSTFSLNNLRELKDAVEQLGKSSYPQADSILERVIERIVEKRQSLERRNAVQEAAQTIAALANQLAQAQVEAEKLMAPAKTSKSIAGKGR